VKVDLSALAWRKSTFSGGGGGTNCVEVALVWRKSSFSGSAGGTDCVEVALPGGGAAIRDSKNSCAAIVVSRAAWTNLLRVTRLT
jgi:uncharacterized protein DUF397